MGVGLVSYLHLSATHFLASSSLKLAAFFQSVQAPFKSPINSFATPLLA